MSRQSIESKQHNDIVIEVDDDDITLSKTVTKLVTKSKLKVATKPNSENNSDGKPSPTTTDKRSTKSLFKKETDIEDPS